jgi:MFS family permease
MKMKKSVWLPIAITLEIIALEVGAYTYAALHHREPLHILAMTLALGVIALIVGSIVARTSKRTLLYGMIAFGIVALCIGLYSIRFLHYHERAGLAIGTGLICLVGGCAGILVPRSRLAVLAGVVILGAIALGIGFYNLTVLEYYGRAYMVLGTGALCVLIGLVGLATLHRTRTQLRT